MELFAIPEKEEKKIDSEAKIYFLLTLTVTL
jgi:hypothetical protein